MAKRRPPGEKAFAIFDDEGLLNDMRQAVAPAEPAPAVVQPEPVRSPEPRRQREIAQPVAMANYPAAQAAPVSAPAELELREPPRAIGMEPTELVKFRVPLPTKNNFQRFRAEWRSALGAQIDESQVGRILIDVLLLDLAPYILDVTQERTEPMRRPVNRDHVAMAAFEESLKAIVMEATKRHRRRLRSEENKPSGRA